MIQPEVWLANERRHLSTDGLKRFCREVLRLLDAEETRDAIAALESYKQPVKLYTAAGVALLEPDANGIIL